MKVTQPMTSHAFLEATRTGTVDGPLQGHHREWYVVTPGGELAELGRVKVGAPRDGILWFDRRYFTSEDELLVKLSQLGVRRIPPVRRVTPQGPVIHGFVEGHPLNEIKPAGTWVDASHLNQIMEVFDRLARVGAETVGRWNIATSGEWVPEDSARFLQGLIRFTRNKAYKRRLRRFGALFEELGVSARWLAPTSPLARNAARLTPRPFCLLHGDLHRANFIVDSRDELWTIDWELAAVGDPLYDLATHLYLMRYPEDQRRAVTEMWRTIMDDALPKATAGLDEDLPRYLAYKHAQSLYADVVRQAVKVQEAPLEEREEQLHLSVETVEKVFVRARAFLDVTPPCRRSIESAYRNFCSAG